MALTDIQPARDGDDAVVEEPPRNTSKAKLPDSCVLRRSACNRTALAVPAQAYAELRCSASITAYVDRDSRFHSLAPLNARTAADYARTHVHCWHDACAFDGPVVPLPKAYDAAQRSFVVYGCFCSLACAKAFLCERSTFETGMQLILLERMAAEVYGVRNVVAAPPRLALDIFGGPYSLERFRALATPGPGGGGGAEATIVAPPFVASYMVCEERTAAAAVKLSALGVNGISSVRGLRRPAQPVDMGTREPPEHSPYLDFLKAKGVDPEKRNEDAAPTASAPSADAAAAPQTRATTRSSKGGTLARFMQA